MMRTIKPLCLVLVALSAPATADDAADIRKLIPAAAAMSPKDFKRLATLDSAPTEETVEEKSLTLMLFTFKIRLDDDAKMLAQFKFLDATPKASDLAAELCRVFKVGNVSIPLGPVTMIHANRITDCSCKIDGHRATGTVSFKVPKLYQGKVDYVAKRTDDKWQIVEFAMPGRDIHIVRGDDGKWKK